MNSTFKKTFPFIALALSALLTGCVSTSTQMVNDKGQVANCGATGWGWIGAPVAYAMSQDCIGKYQAAGFHESGSPVPATSGATTTVASPQPVLTSPTTIAGKDGFFKITLPAGWAATPPPNQSYQLAARNTAADTYLLISAVNAADIADWLPFTENMKSKLVGNLTDAKASETQKIKVNGFDALRADIGGTLKNGLKVHYLGTVLKTDKNLVYVLSWTTESKFASARGDMEQLPTAMQF